MKFVQSLVAGIAIAAAFTTAANADATLRFATAAPEKTPWAAQIQRLAAAIEEESEGRVTVEVFYNSQLGSENDTIAQLARGRIEMGLFTLTSAAQQEPALSIAQLTMFYENDAQRGCVFDNHLFEPLSEILADRGIHLLTWGEVGHGYVFGNQPYPNIDALAGARIAITSSRISTGLWNAWGANPVPISPAEQASAATTGLIDGAATVYTFAIPSGLTQALNVVTEIPYMDAPAMFAMSERVWNSLDEDDQAAITRAAARMSPDQMRQEIFAFEDVMRGLHTQRGGEIYVPTVEELDTFRSRLPDYWAAMAADYGDMGARIFSLVSDGKAACGS